LLADCNFSDIFLPLLPCTWYVNVFLFVQMYVATDDEKLLFYGFFKQATVGDCTIPESSEADWIKKAKTSAWRQQKGSSKRDGQSHFLTLLRKVAPTWDL
jgi:diazepam-binding inhibitor (GABA receptor modulator, acyl-CoA-binding protein)